MTGVREAADTAKYRTIVADPPWRIAPIIPAGGRRARTTSVPYRMLDVRHIASLPVADFADVDAYLFLWATRRIFREGDAVTVARAWGFEPCGEIIWGLRNPGMGASAFVNDHEPVLVGRRGSPPELTERAVGVYFWRQRYVNGGKQHSAKPDGFLDFVENNAPGPYLEMFARRQRLGWDTWGDEALGHVEMSS